MNSYLSTPKFIMCLTDLSLELIEQPDRNTFLQEELKKINRKLPAAVYLPFVNGNTIKNNFLKIPCVTMPFFTLCQMRRKFSRLKKEPLFCCILRLSVLRSSCYISVSPRGLYLVLQMVQRNELQDKAREIMQLSRVQLTR